MSHGFARWQFERRYARAMRARGRYRDGSRATLAAYDRGLATSWRAYQSALRCLHRSPGAFKTTNGQRAAALQKAGRPRSERTVRRTHRLLEEMGVMRAEHVKRSGAARRPGELDCLSISPLCRCDVRPPFGEGHGPESALADSGVRGPLPSTTTATDEIPPPTAADQEGRPSAPPTATEEGGHNITELAPQDEFERQRRFEAMWEAAMAAGRATSDGRSARGEPQDSDGSRTAPLSAGPNAQVAPESPAGRFPLPPAQRRAYV